MLSAALEFGAAARADPKAIAQTNTRAIVTKRASCLFVGFFIRSPSKGIPTTVEGEKHVTAIKRCGGHLPQLPHRKASHAYANRP